MTDARDIRDRIVAWHDIDYDEMVREMPISQLEELARALKEYAEELEERQD